MKKGSIVEKPDKTEGKPEDKENNESDNVVSLRVPIEIYMNYLQPKQRELFLQAQKRGDFAPGTHISLNKKNEFSHLIGSDLGVKT